MKTNKKIKTKKNNICIIYKNDKNKPPSFPQSQKSSQQKIDTTAATNVTPR